MNTVSIYILFLCIFTKSIKMESSLINNFKFLKQKGTFFLSILKYLQANNKIRNRKLIRFYITKILRLLIFKNGNLKKLYKTLLIKNQESLLFKCLQTIKKISWKSTKEMRWKTKILQSEIKFLHISLIKINSSKPIYFWQKKTKNNLKYIL